MKEGATTCLVVIDGSSASTYVLNAGLILGSSCELFSAASTANFIDAGMVAATKSIRHAITSARKTKAVASVPTKINIALCAPWVHGELYDVNISYDSPSKRSTKQIVEEVEAARLEHADALAKASKGMKLVCISARTVRLFENGYAVAKPVAGEPQTIRATTFAHYMNIGDKKTIEDHIRKAVPGAKIEITSVISTLVSDACKPDDGLSDALILSVSANITEAIVINDDMVDAVVTIPTGYSELIEEAERSLPVAGDALGFLSKFALGELSERESDRAGRVFDRASSAWSNRLRETLKASDVASVPSDIVLAPAPAIAALVARFVDRQTVVAELFSGSKPKIHPFPHVRLLTAGIPDVF